jgi:hypothetical protein
MKVAERSLLKCAGSRTVAELSGCIPEVHSVDSRAATAARQHLDIKRLVDALHNTSVPTGWMLPFSAPPTFGKVGSRGIPGGLHSMVLAIFVNGHRLSWNLYSGWRCWPIF